MKKHKIPLADMICQAEGFCAEKGRTPHDESPNSMIEVWKEPLVFCIIRQCMKT